MGWKRRLGGTLCALALLAGACRAADGGPSATPPPTAGASTTLEPFVVPALAWEPCGQAECATLTVPRDHDRPRAGTFDLRVARRRAERPDLRLGAVVYLPGGPARGGTAGLIDGSARFGIDLRARFDLVSWDPRGSSPGTTVDCVDGSDYFRGLDPTPETRAEEAAVEERVAGFIAGCATRSAALLPYLSTTATARDLDLLRAALGEEALTYLGVGYGGAVGAVYATLFPGRVRAMVLDGGYDLSADPMVLAGQAATARARALRAVLEDCAADPLCYFHNAGTSVESFDRLLARLEAGPMVVSPSLPPVDEGEAWRGILFALPDEGERVRLTMALHEAEAGDAMELLLLSEESASRVGETAEAVLAIGCLDWPSRGRPVAGTRPGGLPVVLGTGPSEALCERWAAPPDPVPPVTGRGAGPILVVAQTGDPVVAFESSRALARHLEEGVLLVVEGTGHGAYRPARPDRACAVATIDWHLISGNLPADGSRCSADAGLPQPPG